jgi:hypothetical protein
MSRPRPILRTTLAWTLLLAFLLSTVASSLHTHIGAHPEGASWQAAEIATDLFLVEADQCSFCQASRRLDSETQETQSVQWSPSLALLSFSGDAPNDATDSGLLSSSRSRAPPAQA